MAETDQSADGRAFARIVTLIRQGEIAPGQRLFEPELASRLEMSRTPLRAALSRLVAEGVLLREPGHKGYLVPPLSERDMTELFSARAVLEGLAARECAQRASGDQIHALRLINWDEGDLYARGLSDDDRAAYAALNEQFHRSIVEFSGNAYLSRFFDQIYWRASLYPLIFAPVYGDDQARRLERTERHVSWQEHADVIDAIERRDAERARRLMEEHLMNTRRYRTPRL